MSQIRKAQIVGTFYSADKSKLQSDIKKMLAANQSTNQINNIIGIVVPHAGYIYSGKIAANAYKQISHQNFENVIVISPSHYDYFEGCSVFNGIYETPLGQIEANWPMIDALSQSEMISASNLGHKNEHALEIQLPFLQFLLPSFKLIPIVMGIQNIDTAQSLAKIIFNVLSDAQFKNQKTLIVSSSDLSHFYDVETAGKLDHTVISDLESFDEKKFNDHILNKKSEACGSGPILAGMHLSKLLGANESKVVAYGTSADTNKDINKVVGYLSAVFYKNKN